MKTKKTKVINKAGKTCLACGHLIYKIKRIGYKCFCDKCITSYKEF